MEKKHLGILQVKKIAIILDDITGFGGTERAVCNLANLLSESRKYLVSIISMSSISGGPVYDINNDVRIYHFGLSRPPRETGLSKCKTVLKNLACFAIGYMVSLLGDMKHAPYRGYSCLREGYIKLLLRHIMEFVQENNVHIVLGTHIGINVWLFFLRKGVKTVACEHTAYMGAPFTSRVRRKITYPFLDSVVVLTLSHAKHYSFHKNIKVIPNSLSFQPCGQSKLLGKQILAVGWLIEIKGFDLLVDAISHIKSECKGWQVKIVGSGEEEDKLNKQIESLGLRNYIKIFPQTKKIIQEYLDASILVMSSRKEGLPMVLIEAQSCGLPIVSFDCPEGPSEIVHHNVDGLLVENGNSKKLSEALLELMQNPEKRKQFGTNALQSINRYKPESVFVLWDDLLDAL